VAEQEMENDKKHIERLANKILDRVKDKITYTELNGDAKHRYLGNLKISFAFVEGESLLMALKNYAISSGSACTS
jgi:cysteine desulfurase